MQWFETVQKQRRQIITKRCPPNDSSDPVRQQRQD